jgi:uncharacterized OB-fold protein
VPEETGAGSVPVGVGTKKEITHMAHHLMKRQRLIAHQQRCYIDSCGRRALPRQKLCAYCAAEAAYLQASELRAIEAFGRIGETVAAALY